MIRLKRNDYLPGEIVRAEITFDDTKVRKIIVSFEMGEQTHSTSSDSDGGTDHHYETKMLAYEEFVFEPQTPGCGVTFKLPESCIPIFQYDDRIYTFNRVHVKYDVPFGRDKHEYHTIPVSLPFDLPPAQRIEESKKGFFVGVDSHVLYPRLELPVRWKLPDSVKFREIRIYLILRGKSKAWNITDDLYKEVQLASVNDYEGQVMLRVPDMGIPQYNGVNLQIQYYLKFTVDIPMKFDTNIELPVLYYA